MRHTRILKYLVQPILAEFDEDGNLTGEEAQAVEPVFYPFDLRSLTDRLEKQHLPRREEQRR